jgi:UDP-N-acetylmuramoylalanine--D-glutamate ligase
MRPDLLGKRVLVVGLGLTGRSMVRWLVARGAVVSAADSRAEPPGLAELRAAFPQVPVTTGPFRGENFADVDMLAVSPGVPLAEPEIARAVRAGVPVAGDVELFALALEDVAARLGRPRPKVLGITGSNGKSTVTELAGALCRAAGLETLVAGNIGLPVLDALSEIEAGQRAVPEAVVLELSSFQLETTSNLRADAAVVLNLSEDHLDRYDGMAGYAAAKARIFLGAKTCIVNRDDAWTTGMVPSGVTPWTFGRTASAGAHAWGLLRDGDDDWLTEGAHRLLPARRLKLAGLHNAENALAALALCRAIGLEGERLVPALVEFRGLPHRVELVTEWAGRRFYDDSKGTNVGATVAALRGMREKVVLIAGGDGKGQDFTPLGPAAAAAARAVVLIGRDRELIAEALAPHGVAMSRAADMDGAVSQSFDLSRHGDAILLSPACASFDMFRNYEHRAEAFRTAVSRLQERRA